MTDREREELHRFIAIRVMGWTRAKSEHEVEYYVESHEWCANYTPTTNKAQAFEVLERCAAKSTVTIQANPRYTTVCMLEPSGENHCKVAPTLPEAICLFARELFK